MEEILVCKVCGRHVAKSAKVCPQCGVKLRRNWVKDVLVRMGIGFIILISIGTISDLDKKGAFSNKGTYVKQSSEKKTWNTKEVDILKNDNIEVAVEQLKTSGDIRQKSEYIDPRLVIKAPWNYCGKILKMAGEICVIAEHPVGSSWSKTLGGKEAGQIVILTEDGTAIEMLVVGTTSDLKKGDYVILYGYPVGLLDVPNKNGEKSTHLFIVGDKFERLMD